MHCWLVQPFLTIQKRLAGHTVTTSSFPDAKQHFQHLKKAKSALCIFHVFVQAVSQWCCVVAYGRGLVCMIVPISHSCKKENFLHSHFNKSMDSLGPFPPFEQFTHEQSIICPEYSISMNLIQAHQRSSVHEVSISTRYLSPLLFLLCVLSVMTFVTVPDRTPQEESVQRFYKPHESSKISNTGRVLEH